MLIQSPQDYNECLTALQALNPGERFAIDTETTGLRPWKDTELRGISLWIRGATYYWPVSHPGSTNWSPVNLVTLLNETKGLPVLHNANFDRAVLESIGVRPFETYRDTQILAWLEDENRPKALKKLGELMFGIDASEEQRALKALFKGRNTSECYKELRAQGVPVAEAKERAKQMSAESKRTWADLTASEIAAYAEQDAKLTNDVYLQLLADREYPTIEPAVQRMHDLQDVVYRMVKRGVQVNPAEIHRQKLNAEGTMNQIAARFDVNLNSPPQLAKLIYEEWGLPLKERTESGKPSTSRAALEAMAGMHAGLDEILQYRRCSKSVGTYYLPLLESMDKEARIHPHVNCVGTVTGRFSYSDPNLQTIPRDGTIAGIKDCFVARPGKVLVSYDLKSAELRFMASLSNERGLIEVLEQGGDVYQLTADRVGTTRQVGKSLVLSWPYGVGPVKFARSAGISVKESREVIAGFEKSYPNLTVTMSKLSHYADINGRLPLLEPGRFRRFVGPHLQWPVPSYTALNAACQGGVADTMGNIGILIEPIAEELGAEMVLQVHDSWVFECPIGTEVELSRQIQRITDEVNPLSMPLEFEMKYGM